MGVFQTIVRFRLGRLDDKHTPVSVKHAQSMHDSIASAADVSLPRRELPNHTARFIV